MRHTPGAIRHTAEQEKFYCSQNTLYEIDNERVKQHEKFSNEPLASSSDMVAILIEKLGEVARAVNQQNKIQTKKEIIQLAACCIAYLDGDLHFGKQK